MRRAWTDHEIATLRAIHASDRTLKESQHLLPGRTTAAMSHMLRRLGLEPRLVRSTFRWIEHAALDALADGLPRTSQNLAALVGSSHSRMRRVLRDQHGVLFRVAEWDRSSQDEPSPLWSLGSEPDAPRPAPFGAAERLRRYRARRHMPNPFLTAAGLIAAPSGQKGRVYQQHD
ncbi:hypothetical protein [Burkholderia gladioli]|uniref:hypothetical protein n=1 Tax=Burkholderia gladioli TaxID=28095 RepID=UPI001640EEFC|nr:hypothetical protein [Burkholderia gladioli]